MTLQFFIPYERYARYLKWLTLVLLAYVAVIFTVKIDWPAAALGFVAPRFALTSESFTMVVAIFGTTISPYLMFWQSSQQAEEIERLRLGVAVSNTAALAFWRKLGYRETGEVKSPQPGIVAEVHVFEKPLRHGHTG